MILEKARELGIALSQSEEFIRMQSTQSALESDAAVVGVLQAYREKQGELVENLSSENTDRLLVAALSKDVETLQEQLLSNAIFNAAVEAQNAFNQLMEAVNKEIGTCVGFIAAEEHGCGGSCSGCAGCH